MLKKLVLLAALLGISRSQTTSSSTPGFKKGRCPTLINSYAQQEDKEFDPFNLTGVWKQVLGPSRLQEGFECLTVRINKPINFWNELYYLKQTAGKRVDSDNINIGSDIFMTFKNPEVRTGFGSLTKEDLKVLKHMNEIDQFRKSIGAMTEEERQLLSDRQKQMYREQMDRVQQWKADFQKQLYADGDQVLDTDFDTYVSFYGCQEFKEEVNKNGQSKEEVEKMIVDATLNGQPKPNLNEDYTTTWYSSINVSLFVRDLEATSPEELQAIEADMTKMLGGYNLKDDHSYSVHRPDCTEESSNVFAELDAKRKIEYVRSHQEKEGQEESKEEFVNE